MAKKKTAAPRDKVIKIWLTEAEMQLVRIAAAVAGAPAATYARKIVLADAAQKEQEYVTDKQKDHGRGSAKKTSS